MALKTVLAKYRRNVVVVVDRDLFITIGFDGKEEQQHHCATGGSLCVKRQPFGRHDQCLWVRCIPKLHKIDVKKSD
jgi:hypothetical protein